MKLPNWFSALRALTRIGRSLEGIHLQLTRLADHATGVHHNTPVRDLDDSGEPVVMHRTSEADYIRIDLVERALSRTLGRTPTESELMHEVDGLENGPEDLKQKVREKLGL